MKTNKLLVVTEEFSQVLELHQEWEFSKEKYISLLQQTNMFKNEKILDIADANTHHICKYCGDIAQGIDEDILCADCRDTFGHAFYSEL